MYDPKTGRSYTASGFIREKPRSMQTGKTHEFTTTTGKTVKVPVDDFNDFVAYNRQIDGSGELQTLQANSEIGNYVETGLKSKSLWSIGEFDSGSPRHIMTEARGHISALRYNARRQLLVVDFNGYANNTAGATVCFFRVPTGVAGELYSLFNSGAKRSDGKHMVGVRFWDLIRIRGTLHGSHYRYEYTDGGFSKSIGMRYDSPFNKFHYLNEDVVEKAIDDIAKRTNDPVLSDAYLKTLALPDTERREAKAKVLFKFRYRLSPEDAAAVSYDPQYEVKSMGRQAVIDQAQKFDRFKKTGVKEAIKAKREAASYTSSLVPGKGLLLQNGENGDLDIDAESKLNTEILEMSDAEAERVILSELAAVQSPVSNSKKSFLQQLADGDETVPYIVRGVLNKKYMADPEYPGQLKSYYDSMEGRIIGLWQDYNKIKTNGVQAASRAEGLRKKEEAEHNYKLAVEHFILEAALHGVAKGSRPRATRDSLDVTDVSSYYVTNVNRQVERHKVLAEEVSQQRKKLYRAAKRNFFKDKYDKRYSELKEDIMQKWDEMSDDDQYSLTKKGMAWVDSNGELTDTAKHIIRKRANKYLNKLFEQADPSDQATITEQAETNLTKYIDMLEKDNQSKGFSSQSTLANDIFSEKPAINEKTDLSLRARMEKLGISEEDINNYTKELYNNNYEIKQVPFTSGRRKALPTDTDNAFENRMNDIANRLSYTNKNPYYKYHAPSEKELNQFVAAMNEDAEFERVPIAWDEAGKPTKYGYKDIASGAMFDDFNDTSEDDTFFNWDAWDAEEKKLNKR